MTTGREWEWKRQWNGNQPTVPTPQLPTNTASSYHQRADYDPQG
jgi:hypothetical protein